MDQESHVVTCPYCWQRLNVLVDPSLENQQYVEDCHVCCHPILLTITSDSSGQFSLNAEQE